MVGTDRGREAFDRLERSVVRCTPFPYELIVSDFGVVPLDESRLATIGKLERRILIRESPRLGMARAYNAMFARARGRYVVYLNDDAEVLPGTITAAVGFMQSRPQIAIGALYYQECPGSVWRVNDFRQTVYANFGIVRRDVGEQVGWFGTGVEMYGAENVLAFEAMLAGHGVVAIEGTRIVHHVDALARKEEDSRKLRPAASAYLDREYPVGSEKMKAIKAVHDRYRHLGGAMHYPPHTWGGAM